MKIHFGLVLIKVHMLRLNRSFLSISIKYVNVNCQVYVDFLLTVVVGGSKNTSPK